MNQMSLEIQTKGNKVKKDLEYFINTLNNYIEASGERYTPDVITLFYDDEKIIVGYNYINNKYEVVVLC